MGGLIYGKVELFLVSCGIFKRLMLPDKQTRHLF